MTEKQMTEEQIHFLIRLISMCIANTKHAGDWRDIEHIILTEFNKLGD